MGTCVERMTPALLEGVFGSAPIRRVEEQAATADKAGGA